MFKMLPFPEKFSIFIRQNFLRPFCLFSTNFEFSPYYSNIFPPLSRNFYFPLLLNISKFPPDFVKFACFLQTFYAFRSPIDHDAFMHHTMHVLDAPAGDSESD